MKTIEKLLSKDEIAIKEYGNNPVSVYVVVYDGGITEDEAWDIIELAGYNSIDQLEYVGEDIAVALYNNAKQVHVFHRKEK